MQTDQDESVQEVVSNSIEEPSTLIQIDSSSSIPTPTTSSNEFHLHLESDTQQTSGETVQMNEKEAAGTYNFALNLVFCLRAICSLILGIFYVVLDDGQVETHESVSLLDSEPTKEGSGLVEKAVKETNVLKQTEIENTEGNTFICIAKVFYREVSQVIC